MKTIYLVRHAKSSWDNITQDDHERPLNERGRKDAPHMAKYLANREIAPDISLCSTSKRTKETYSYFTPFFSGVPLSLSRKLYHASVNTLLEEIMAIDNKYSSAFLFGHNNGISEFVSIIMNKNISLATCSFTHIEFDADNWKSADLLKAKIIFSISPKELPQ